MPKVAQPLTPSQLRCLRALADAAGLSRAALERTGAGGQALGELAALGLVRDEWLDLDGLRERVWQATDLGRARLKGAALPAVAKPKAVPVAAGRNGAVEQPKIGALAPWFGGCRRLAGAVGEAFRGVAWVGVPFCGGLSEIPAILAAGVNACALNDAHRHLVNLARVAADPMLGPALYRSVRRQPFCAEALAAAQDYCLAHWPGEASLDLEAACAYFVCCWMGRATEAGREREFNGGLAIRWGAGGGNSVLRYANACGSLRAWRRVLERCSFSSEDAFKFLGRCNDRADGGVYSDCPWFGAGDAYLHRFSAADHERLAKVLGGFKKARVVVRLGGGPEAERLYPRRQWEWLEQAGRSQANKVGSEWLLRLRNGNKPKGEDDAEN